MTPAMSVDRHDRLSEHFLAIASQAMRRILVDHARTKKRAKRGGEHARVAIEDLGEHPAADDGAPDLDLVALDDALEALAERSPRQARVVELRYFGGLAAHDVAAALGVSVATVEREWRVARAWLAPRLG